MIDISSTDAFWLALLPYDYLPQKQEVKNIIQKICVRSN